MGAGDTSLQPAEFRVNDNASYRRNNDYQTTSSPIKYDKDLTLVVTEILHALTQRFLVGTAGNILNTMGDWRGWPISLSTRGINLELAKKEITLPLMTVKCKFSNHQLPNPLPGSLLCIRTGFCRFINYYLQYLSDHLDRHLPKENNFGVAQPQCLSQQLSE